MTTYRIDGIMRTDFATLASETSIRRAIAVLVESKNAAAAVLDDAGALIGILTGKDCFRPALHASYYSEWTGQVADFMSTAVVSVSVNDEVIGVAEMFLAHPHRVFPVLDGDKVAGLLHRSDVLALLSRLG
ncbi:CBS domain-containing protein [Flavimaricola marinus]|uniref:Inosine 5-monophosphate dehydrogenase n=1 Tax=Flavimaricola marinus TaxID=1819565 RepID=A0A238LED0_9RHOB|nr:CBS domain-containing protein [Flavimaricola marinus]SMY07316.1 inosine 5-monophosphate dehydrogenase [Flavimaricola marinus]